MTRTAPGTDNAPNGLGEPMPELPPVGPATAASAVARSVLRTGELLWRGRIRQPRDRMRHVLRFADGSSGRVYRETVVQRAAVEAPALLVVEFRLRWVRGRGHAVFRAESLLNTPLFVGFPGFVSKLWLAHDHTGTYRGVYQWDGPALAHAYARALWWVLALVSERRSIHYVVIPDLRRDDVLADPALLAGAASSPVGAGEWWQVVASEPAR